MAGHDANGRLRLRIVHEADIVPVAVASGTSCADLKALLQPAIEDKLGRKIPADNLTLLYCEKPLRDINGSALSGVKEDGLIDCVVEAPDDAAAAGAQAAKAEAELMGKVTSVTAAVDELEEQANAGAFDGKDKPLLEALERQLYRLDEVRAAGGRKLYPQVMGARKAMTRRINDMHNRIERRGAPPASPPVPVAEQDAEPMVGSMPSAPSSMRRGAAGNNSGGRSSVTIP